MYGANEGHPLTLLSALSWQWSPFWGTSFARGRRHIQQAVATLAKDWKGARYVSFGLLLLLITSLVVVGYYLNHPQAEIRPDTPSYLNVAQHILANGNLVDPVRTPGYPLLIAAVFLLAGQGNFAAVSMVQGVLFVIATIEIYLVLCLIFRRAWLGLVAGLIIGIDTLLLSFIKPVLSEGLSLWIVASLALAIILFIRTCRASLLWLVAFLVLCALMTHAEWAFVPIPLFAYLLGIGAQRGRVLRLLPHAVLAILILYGCLGLFIYMNATQHNYPGITYIQRINLLGKVMQYHMQNEAPAQYADVTQKLNAYLAAGGEINPYTFATFYPAITDNRWELAGNYASAIVDTHPVEFALHTIPVLLTSSNTYYLTSQIDPQGVFAAPLFGLEQISGRVYFMYRFFPLFALFWFGLLLWQRSSRQAQMMGALAFLGVYELVVVSVGGYGSFARLHTPFDPIMLAVIWGTLLLCIPPLFWSLRTISWTKLLARLWPVIRLAWAIGIIGGGVLSVAATVLLHGTARLADPTQWTGPHWLFTHSAHALALVGAGGIFSLLAYAAYKAQQAKQASAAPRKDQAAEEAPLPTLEGPISQ
ncbi:MAG TPA: hypothetical protein VH599_06700 [Ktedonobacterales bacterium]|jgi:hypothetical protein